MSKRLTETSKFLSYVLRHEPQTIGLRLDREGWANISELLVCAKQAGHHIDEPLIREVVATSEKNRFSLSTDGVLIRAAQGHSTKDVSISYEERVPPAILYHGTADRFLDSILREGLRPGARKHVHLSEDAATATIIGQRYGKPIVLHIEALKIHQAGIKFFQATNGVWLTSEVPPVFILNFKGRIQK